MEYRFCLSDKSGVWFCHIYVVKFRKMPALLGNVKVVMAASFGFGAFDLTSQLDHLKTVDSYNRTRMQAVNVLLTVSTCTVDLSKYRSF